MKNLTNIEIDVVSGGNGPISKALVKLDEVVSDFLNFDPSSFCIALAFLTPVIFYIINCYYDAPKKKPRIK